MPITGTLPLFEQRARELAKRVEHIPTSEARELHTRANNLASLFRSWVGQKPSDDQRIRALSILLDLNREVETFVQAIRTMSTKPPKGEA